MCTRSRCALIKVYYCALIGTKTPGNLNRYRMAVPTASKGERERVGEDGGFIVDSFVVLNVANALLERVGLPQSVQSLEHCDSILFFQLYEALTGTIPSGGL